MATRRNERGEKSGLESTTLPICNKTKCENLVSNIPDALFSTIWGGAGQICLLESSHGSGGRVNMSTSGRSRIGLPLILVVTAFALSAQAQEQNHSPSGAGQGGAAAQAARPGPAHAAQTRARGPQDGRYARGGLPERNFGGHVYHGRQTWEGGRWRHEAHNGRYGWWWDVGGVRYFYPQPMEGPPAYVSDLEVVGDYGGPDGPPVGAAYPPPPVAYAPPAPPPPPPDPAAGAVGGAIIGGLLGGLISGRPGGAIAGAVAGGTVGAIAGAQAAARPGYYLAQGDCYYRHPSGQYVQVDPRSCY
jgi:hypothetical protein